MSEILKMVTGMYDSLFDKKFPYMMCMHNSPVNSENSDEYFHFHIEFYPPLRSKTVQQFNASSETGAWAHCNPSSPEEKAADNAPNGIIGLETAFAVSYTKLVKPGLISLQKLIELMSLNPAKILNLKRGEGDFAIFDLGTAYKINSSEFASKSRNTPFEGMEVYGRTVMTVRNGRIIYNDRSFN